MHLGQHPEKKAPRPSRQEVKQTPVVLAMIRGESLGPFLCLQGCRRRPASRRLSLEPTTNLCPEPSRVADSIHCWKFPCGMGGEGREG